MSHSQFHSIKLILRHAWLSLWDKHMTTGRINQVSIVMFIATSDALTRPVLERLNISGDCVSYCSASPGVGRSDFRRGCKPANTHRERPYLLAFLVRSLPPRVIPAIRKCGEIATWLCCEVSQIVWAWPGARYQGGTPLPAGTLVEPIPTYSPSSSAESMTAARSRVWFMAFLV